MAGPRSLRGQPCLCCPGWAPRTLQGQSPASAIHTRSADRSRVSPCLCCPGGGPWNPGGSAPSHGMSPLPVQGWPSVPTPRNVPSGWPQHLFRPRPLGCNAQVRPSPPRVPSRLFPPGGALLPTHRACPSPTPPFLQAVPLPSLFLQENFSSERGTPHCGEDSLSSLFRICFS